MPNTKSRPKADQPPAEKNKKHPFGKLRASKSKVQTKSKKAVVKKIAAVKVSKPVAKKQAAKVSRPEKKAVKSVSKAVHTSSANLTVSVYGLDGKVSGKVSLPKEIFGETVNKKLLAQAVRVYQANKRQGNANTKTRGEVDGSTRKIYRQKGTGNARHGSLRAPIFVKGGIVHGPRVRDFGLELPKKMKRKALFSALSAKLADGEVKVLSGLEKITPKTKQFAQVIEKLAFEGTNKKLLLVAPDNFENARRASRNLTGITNTSAVRLNALEVLSSKHLLFTKEAITEMETYFLKKGLTK